jgi:DNA-binding MarR family transcriptional regulator
MALTMNVITDIDPVLVAGRLRPVLVKLNRELRREVGALGVTNGQLSLLYAIDRSPGIGVRELALREGISAPGMSGHVDRLEAAGFATRARSAEDRRRVGIEITDEGRRVLRAAKTRRTAWLAKRLKALSPEEREAIDAAIEPLSALLEVGV